MTQEFLELLSSQDWGKILPQLFSYAEKRISYLNVKRLAKGLDAKDIVLFSIEQIYHGQRNWDPQKAPELKDALISIINSNISNNIYSSEYKKRKIIDDSSEEENNFWDSQTTGENPEKEIEFKELRGTIYEFLDDSEEDQTILMCIEDGYTNKEIAKMLEKSIRDIENAKKRIKRKLLKEMHSKGYNLEEIGNE